MLAGGRPGRSQEDGMVRYFSVGRPGGWLASSAAIWLVVVATLQARPPVSPAATPEGAPPAGAVAARPQDDQAAAPAYVGEETCMLCHAEVAEGYVDSVHHRTSDPRTPAAARGCETCHGPGSLHVQTIDPAAIVNPARLPPAEASALCITCHNRGNHVLWEGSAHDMRGLACTSCHSQHAAQSETRLLKASTELATCATCHRDKVAKLDQAAHMPVREGKLQCTSCHNPHGSTNERLLRVGDSIGELCTSCHAEKRGPYLWEHAPAQDGCVTCHDPHGSSNERMLIARTPILCQRCHVDTATQHPSTVYDGAAVQSSLYAFGRSCVTCHANIHGSNHPNGQRFLR